MAKLAVHGELRLPLPCNGPLHYRVLGRRGFRENPLGFERSRAVGWCGKVCCIGYEKMRRSFSVEEECLNVECDEYEYDVDDIGDKFSCFRSLVLDISYRPVNVVCWKRAICLEFTEKADVLEYYDQTVSSVRGSFYIPAVLRVPQLLQVMKKRRIKYDLNRKNLLSRDNYTCQYCSSRENLTIDHVLPISRGGERKWENLVTACAKCNFKKGQKTMEEANMTLLKPPKAPKDYDMLAIPLTSAALRSLKMRKVVPEEWLQYLT